MDLRTIDTDTASEASGGGVALALTLDDDLAAPIRAGMRARRMADACDRLALAAILIDRSGRVLHVAAAAAPLLEEGEVCVVAGHIVGRTPAANHRIASAVTAAIGMPDEGEAGSKLGGTGMIGLPVSDPSPCQILRGIVVLGVDAAALPRIEAFRPMLG